ncbi:MAG: BMP family lipoprotein [Bacillota bacterium]
MKRALALVLVLVLTLTMFAGCGQKAAVKANVTYGMVTDVGGLGDKSFNDSAWEGLKRAEKEFGVEPKILQSTKQEDYEANLGNMAQSVDLTIAVGFLFENAMKAVADQYPDKKFGVIDTVADKANVMSVLFKEHEGSFLVGVIAGLTTKSNVIGFVGGMEIPVIEKFEAGFIAGVKSVNPNAQVLVDYTGDFGKADLGKEVALKQFAQNADVIFHASGACGIGVIQAADEKGFWAIGVDQDQAKESKNNKVLCSMIKRVDTGTYTITKALVENKFEGGKVMTLGLKEEGVGYSDGGKNVPAEISKKADAYKKSIIEGKIVVPATRAELANFKPVQP